MININWYDIDCKTISFYTINVIEVDIKYEEFVGTIRISI